MPRVHGPTVRPYVLPPNTPKDRVQILRKAFMDTMKDPEFLAEAKKANLDINPDDGATSEQNVKEILKLEPALDRQAERDFEIEDLGARKTGGSQYERGKR